MLRDSPHHHWLLALLCSALLLFHAGGAHLHLCFDGKEPPAQFHLFDGGVHHEESGANDVHRDAELAVTGGVISQFSQWDDNLPLLLFAVAFLWPVLGPTRGFAARSVRPVHHATPTLLLPPPRAPPR